MAEISVFHVGFGRVTADEWNVASMLSGPDLFDYEPHSDQLHEVFREIVA